MSPAKHACVIRRELYKLEHDCRMRTLPGMPRKGATPPTAADCDATTYISSKGPIDSPACDKASWALRPVCESSALNMALRSATVASPENGIDVKTRTPAAVRGS